MAFAAVVSLIQTIDRILYYDTQHYPISDTGKQQMESLRENAVLLRQMLLKFPKEATSLETRMRDAANEAEDVIEHFMYEHLRSYHNSIRPTDLLYDFHELEIVMQEFNSTVQEVVAAVIQKEREQLGGGGGSSSSAPIPAPAVDTVTFGLEERVNEIRGLLCGRDLARKVISITGMCGIGKTTLANTLYHHPEVIGKFPVRAWVTVSQNYNTQNIFADLLSSVEKVVKEGLVESSDSTVDKLHKILSMNKFLIVLDDLWSEKAWDEIEKAFGKTWDSDYKHKGSRIMITTRNENVAFHAGHSLRTLYRMDLMDEDNSWVMLKHKVFPNSECPAELDKIGKKIAKACQGVPLAIVVIAGILSTTPEVPSSWEEVEQNIRSFLQKDDQFQKRMYLSYTHLPIYSRLYLLYMGGFPEDNEIRVSKLFKLWIAEGFVPDEEVARRLLLDLIWKNLVMITTTKSNGIVKSCNLHQFVRDMCETIALDENYERRLSIAHPELRCVAKHYASTLRTAICFRPTESSLVCLRKFRLLRVLDMVDTEAYSLPPHVFELFHLRYLAFGCGMEIPAAISRLQNLRTMIIRPSKRSRKYSSDEVYLPLEIWMLPLLENLVSFFDLLPNPNGATSALENLLTLSVVKKLICTQEMMEMIPNVKKLAITYFGDRYQQDYQLHNLILLTQLEKLTLVMKKGDLLQLKANPVFPKTLKKLTLSGWRFPWEDMEAVATLPYLQVLKLRDHAFEGNTWDTIEESYEDASEESYEDAMEEFYEGDTWETDAGQFPELKYLLIDESDLEKWFTQKEHFPALKHLVLNACGKLKRIPDDIGCLRSLLIEFDRANIPLLECVQRMQKEQTDQHNELWYGDKPLQVRAL